MQTLIIAPDCDRSNLTYLPFQRPHELAFLAQALVLHCLLSTLRGQLAADSEEDTLGS